MRSATMLDGSDDLYFLNLPQDSGIASPENSYAVNEINDVISSFDEGYRIPFSMHLSGYKYSEIAQHMKLPVGTVKSRIYYARKRLRVILKDYESRSPEE